MIAAFKKATALYLVTRYVLFGKITSDKEEEVFMWLLKNNLGAVSIQQHHVAQAYHCLFHYHGCDIISSGKLCSEKVVDNHWKEVAVALMSEEIAGPYDAGRNNDFLIFEFNDISFLQVNTGAMT